MKKLTQNEIERIVEAVEVRIPPLSGGDWRTELLFALSTVTLDQPKIDLCLTDSELIEKVQEELNYIVHITNADLSKAFSLNELMNRFQSQKKIDLKEVENLVMWLARLRAEADDGWADDIANGMRDLIGYTLNDLNP